MRLQAFWEARWILAFLALLAIVSGLFSAWAFWFFVLLFLCTIAFFRDPDRAAPVDPNVIVAAADGTVMDIVELDENEVLKNKTRRVGIFLSVFDVHTNRAPIDGRVIYRQHRPGLCLDARRPDCSEKNESMTWAFENPRVTVVVRQITGRHRKTHRGVGERGRRIKKRRTLRDDSLRLANGIIFAAFRHRSRQGRRPRGGWSDSYCATA